MLIDLTVLSKAVHSLKTVLEKTNDDENIVRDSSIQRFEYTYELLLKFLWRYIHELESTDKLPFKDMIRVSLKLGLVKSEIKEWESFRELRNMTVHTYNEKVAQDVYAKLPSFLKEAEYVLNALQRKAIDA